MACLRVEESGAVGTGLTLEYRERESFVYQSRETIFLVLPDSGSRIVTVWDNDKFKEKC